MTGSPLRVAFAGLAHSHPYTDAANVRALGAEVVGVHDADAVAAEAFAARFGGVVASSVGELTAVRPDLVIATPLPHEVVPFLQELGGGTVPVFVNKVIAATAGQFAAVDSAVAASAVPVGTGSVLRFAPALAAFAAGLSADEVLSIRVLAQHDNAAFLSSRSSRSPRSPLNTPAPVALSVARSSPERQEMRREQGGRGVPECEGQDDRERGWQDDPERGGRGLRERGWQDDPERGGGTLVTVGVHAWEMVDVLLPGAALVAGSGWTRTRAGSETASEDAAGVDGHLRLPDAEREVPVQVLVTGTPGPDAYAVDVVTAAGIRSLSLDVDDANEALGFRGLIRALLDAAPRGVAVAPWAEARVVVENTVLAAGIARGDR